MEIKYNDFLSLIRDNIKILFITIFIVNLLSIFVAFFIVPVKYTSEAIVSPVYSNDNKTASSPLSSLAALGGFNIGTGSAQVPRHLVGLEIMKSKSFFKEISDSQFIKDLHDVDYFDTSKNLTIYKNKKDLDQKFEDSHDKFLEALTIRKNRESGVISISMTHKSPITAQEWLSDIINRTNTILRDRDLHENENSINFLKSVIIEEKDIEIRKILNELLKEELSKLLLVNKNIEYAFKIIDPPSLPTRKSYPSRLNLLIMGFIVSLLLSFAVLTFPRFRSFN